MIKFSALSIWSRGKHWSNNFFKISLVDQNQLKQDLPRKRLRTTFSASQLKRLEGEFRCNMYVVGLKRLRLAQELQLEERHIKIWFQNRRMKFKRDQRLNERHAAAAFQNYCFYWKSLYWTNLVDGCLKIVLRWVRKV